MKYRTDGIGKNKKIRKERNKPLPLELMKHDEFNGFKVAIRVKPTNIGNGENIQSPTYD
jgi:hypothetical protein